jgi:chromosome segregation ATPase
MGLANLYCTALSQSCSLTIKSTETKTLMENKKTTELLELLHKLPSEGEETWGERGTYEQIMGELKTRYPFYDILNENNEESLPSAWDAIKELQDEIKKLKRHKHDPKTGDVMIRI